jgi:integrase
MNLKKLRINYPELLTYLETHNYSKGYISKFRTEIKHILNSNNSDIWSCYKDIYDGYVTSTRSDVYLREKRTIIGAIERFDIYGQLPDGRTRQKLVQHNSYHLLIENYKVFIDLYCDLEHKRGKKNTTVSTESHNASVFLLSIQEQGIRNLNDVTEKNVLSFFITENGKLIRGCSYRKNITAVFKACLIHYPEACGKILSYLPMLRESRKTIQYLTTDEFSKIKATLLDCESQLSFRNRAIALLIMYTGLRGCDVSNMIFESIDWENDKIFIVQQKTEAALELPLSAVVGNAIFDYLTKERPKVNSPYIFLTQNKPYNPFNNRSIGNIATKVMRLANVRTNKNDRKGFHLFRHHLATTLLGNNVPQPVISRTLGHTSPNSLYPYISADFVHLKECALSIDLFETIEDGDLK